MFFRTNVFDGGLSRLGRMGDCIMTCFGLTTTAVDTPFTLPAQALAGGMVQITTFTVNRVVTLDTAVNLLALFQAMDVGDNFAVFLSNTSASNVNLAAGAGVTLAGRPSVLPTSMAVLVITKTSATTVIATLL